MRIATFSGARNSQHLNHSPRNHGPFGICSANRAKILYRMARDFIPVNEPLLDGNEKKYLNECIDTGWISSEGPFVQRFEENMAAVVGRKRGIAVCNGTVALETAVAALELQPGDEVILPAFTIVSCVAAIVRRGCVPVLVDSDPITWNMDVAQIEAR